VFGYEVGDVPIKLLTTIKKSLRVVWKQPPRGRCKSVSQVSLGCHVVGAALPCPDAQSPINMYSAIVARLGRWVPGVELDMLWALRRTTEQFCVEFLTPLSRIPTIMEWLAETTYPEWRKIEILEALDIIRKAENRVYVDSEKDRVDAATNSFVKEETYDDYDLLEEDVDVYKWPRAINARSDVLKRAFGPAIHAIEKVLFKLAWFVKFIPVRLRPAFIKERLFEVGAVYVGTDYSAFEALLVPAIMRNCELVMYRYMLQNAEGGKEVGDAMEEAMTGTNVMRFKWVTARVDGVRMSGDMCTSCGNGFTNLMIMRTVCAEQHIVCDGVVEGDDGCFRVSRVPDIDSFTRCGMIIKMKTSQVLGETGFCKMFFDEEEMQNIADPRVLLCKFGMTHSALRHSRRFRPALLRAKAYSLQAELPGCPIAQQLASYALRVGVGGSSDEELVGHRLYQSVYRKYGAGESRVPVGPRTRALMGRLFGVGESEQLAIERYLDESSVLEPLPFTQLMPKKWCRYYDQFARWSDEPSASAKW
jgi:hypothetical protein